MTTTTPTVEQIVLDEAIRQLSVQESGGFGQDGTGSFQKGAPVRTTASAILDSIKPGRWNRGGNPLARGLQMVDVQHILHESGVFDCQKVGNNLFFSLKP